MYWNLLLIFLIVALILSSIGFYKYVYFLSVGYGLAISGISVAVIITMFKNFNAIDFVLAILLFLYGIRLSGFLIFRELKSKQYKKTLNNAMKTQEKMNVFVKLSIWISVAVLYTAQVCPVFYRVANKSEDMIIPIIGIIISLVGLVVETMADLEKSKQKLLNPKMVATKKLYSVVRCPNYLGEILFWTGIFVSGVTSLNRIGQWLLAIISYVSIVSIMINGAKRLEKGQNQRYGNNEEYIKYRDKTPILFPLIHIYHL